MAAASTGCAFLPANDSRWYPFGRRLFMRRENCEDRFSNVGSVASTIATTHVVPARNARAKTVARSFGDVSYSYVRRSSQPLRGA